MLFYGLDQAFYNWFFVVYVMWQTLPAAVSGLFEEEEELDDDELGHAETYADYMPAKCES